MLLVNEAWDVLSDPELRRRYDEGRARAEAGKQSTGASASNDARSKKRKDRSALKSNLAEDFARAAFNHGTTDDFGCPDPGESISGHLFIILGFAGAGFVIGYLEMIHPAWSAQFGFELLCCAGLAVIGAKAGAFLHLVVGQLMGIGRNEAAADSMD